MKAILVIDMPYYCCTCQFFRFKYRDDYDSKETVCTINGYVNENGIDTIASWCPLKPMPKPKEENDDGTHFSWHSNDWWNAGWNACLEKIGGKNESTDSD